MTPMRYGPHRRDSGLSNLVSDDFSRMLGRIGTHQGLESPRRLRMSPVTLYKAFTPNGLRTGPKIGGKLGLGLSVVAYDMLSRGLAGTPPDRYTTLGDSRGSFFSRVQGDNLKQNPSNPPITRVLARKLQFFG